MKPVSKKLSDWADVFMTSGLVMVALSVVAWFISDGDVSVAFLTGITLVILNPVFNGLSVLVKNAEQAIQWREEAENTIIGDNEERP